MFTRFSYPPIVPTFALVLVWAWAVPVLAQTGATTTAPPPPPAAPAPVTQSPAPPTPTPATPPARTRLGLDKKGEIDLDLGPTLEEVKEAEKEGRAGSSNMDGSAPKAESEPKAGDGSEPDSEIFSDGFESGDQPAWSSEDGR